MEPENMYAAPKTPNAAPPTAPKNYGRSAARFVLAAIVLLFIAAMLLPNPGYPRSAALRTVCLNNCRQIALAIINYESANGHFPPAYVADENGKPMHSWRVLILPYLDQKELFDRYDQNEPWNGPNNSKLHNEIVDVYRCPSSTSSEFSTDYVLITGTETGFSNDQTTDFGDITDGSSNTILLTEIASSRIHWMQPRDISLEQFVSVRGPAGGEHENHPGTRNVAFFDGSTHVVDLETAPDELRKFVTIAGDETVNIDDL